MLFFSLSTCKSCSSYELLTSGHLYIRTNHTNQAGSSWAELEALSRLTPSLSESVKPAASCSSHICSLSCHNCLSGPLPHFFFTSDFAEILRNGNPGTIFLEKSEYLYSWGICRFPHNAVRCWNSWILFFIYILHN